MDRQIRILKTSIWMRKLQKILQNKGLNGLSEPCNIYFKRHKRHFLGGIAVLCCFTFLTPFTLIHTSKKIQTVLPRGDLAEYGEWKDGTGSALSTSGSSSISSSSSSSNGDCTVSEPKSAIAPIQPVLVPTFPGGSSDLMKFLIEASTGIWTGNRPDKHDVIAIKTHYPYYEKHASVQQLKVDQPAAVVVLRDPLDTLVVWHTYIENAIKRDPKAKKAKTSTKWSDWIEHHFEVELKKWEEFHRYWLNENNINRRARHIAVYEKLVDMNYGAQEAIDMVDFIQRMTNVQPSMPHTEIPCIWNKVIQLKVDPYRTDAVPTGGGKRRMLKKKNVTPPKLIDAISNPFTYIQLDKVATIITNLIEEYSYDEKILSTFIGYRSSILEKMTHLQGNEPILIHNSHGTCIVTTPKYEKGIVPIFQASYPGSGSAMMRDLVEATTGYKTNSGSRRNDVVAVKTQYPYRPHDVAPGFMNKDMKRMVLLIRYPLNAIGSNFAHIYWEENGIAPHSMQPPTEAWEKWRDTNLEEEIDAWIELFFFWIHKFKAANRMVVSYEALNHAERGPQQAIRLAFFIKGSSAGGVEINPAPTFTIPCLWFRAVRINDQANTDIYQANRFQKDSTYAYSFTKDQLEMAATKMNDLYRKFNYDLQLGPIFQGYWEHTISMIKGG